MNAYTIKPILLIMWNRPHCVRQALQTLSLVKPAVLYIASDGFTQGCEETNKNISQCRKIVDQYVSWQCQVHTLYRQYNLGCKDAVSDAITWFFKHEESGIILEDDVICDSSFFRFASELLDTYKDNPRIGLISANAFNAGLLPLAPNQYTFTTHPHIWGWATWKRVWDMYDKNLTYCKVLRSAPTILSNHGIFFFLFWFYTWHNVINNRINTWDYQLSYLFYAHELLSIIPAFELAQNIGFGPGAAHTADGHSPLQPIRPVVFPIHPYPRLPTANKKRDRLTFITNYLPNNLTLRFRRKLVKIFSSKKTITHST